MITKETELEILEDVRLNLLQALALLSENKISSYEMGQIKVTYMTIADAFRYIEIVKQKILELQGIND